MSKEVSRLPALSFQLLTCGVVFIFNEKYSSLAQLSFPFEYICCSIDTSYQLCVEHAEH